MTNGKHPIDAAIKSTTPPDQVALVQIRVDFEPGRFVMLAVPPDITIEERFHLVGWLSRPDGGLTNVLVEANGPVSRVWTPGRPM